MKHFRLSMAALLVASAATAQTIQPAEKYAPTVYLIGVEESVAVDDACDKLELMSDATQDYHETHRHGFQQTAKPMFIFATRDNRYSLALGGFIALRASYDFNGISDNLDFIPYNIPLTADYNNRQQLLMDASTSRLYFKGIANSNTLGRVVIYMDADFRGGATNSYTPRVRSAYVSMLGFTLGRDVTTFCDLNAAPTTIDFQGPNAYNFNFATMIRYEYSMVDNHLKMGVAAEMPNVSATYNDSFLAMRQRIPDIPIYFQYAWDEDRSSHLRASAVFRNMYVRNAVQQSDERFFGWGVQFSGTIKAVDWLRFYMNGVYGKGITPYIQDLTGSGLDMVPNVTNGEEIELLPMWGWQAAAQINISPRAFFSGGYSMVDVERKDNFATNTMYSQGRYIFGNVFYSLTPRCMVGAEYLYGSRKNMDGVKGTANRINVQLMYHF
ncbi:MAG: porin [Alistipes sp.]|nr:porin [Alistipes sp.]